ncbi:hypothetical protein F4Y93_15320, partial [Candidatus Poribacteria bacterium]|nr:hypothetical protein [Candidatus Poribacteria bacterium]
MRCKINLIGYVLLLTFGCFFISGNLSAQDNNASVYVIDIRNEIGSGINAYISDGIKLAEQAGADAI